ncbi:acyltransferase [Rhodobacteraceae bacterium RKSG542]|uniref:acyltransferase family protein n=1 Tax=Pseudovibrio flavus TaxID=2529854 RepID=UPI0012BBD123|nr:acyltransferase family protein [Pseudovibrio flavus]MTI17251.1 acyltransferase [Pseudovibrio flavus]
MQTSKPDSFRGDIEGLRGVAVLLVLLFHFELFGFTAGFIGVDIFFVISGFLMTQIIMRPNFNWSGSCILNFYVKRFWRLAPAYYFAAVLAALTIWSTLGGLDFTTITEAFTYSTFFSYNIIAPTHMGYFAPEALLNPFLHFWSLGVEIQFYILWPILLFFIKRTSLKRQIASVFTISVISFIVMSILIIKDPEAAYFSIPARLWEFGVGAIAALLTMRDLEFKHYSGSVWLYNTSMVVLLLFSFTPANQGWPSPLTLLPVLATGIIIAVGSQSSTRSLNPLNNTLLRRLGKWSYSTYLVHWPIAVLCTQVLTDYADNALVRLAALITSVFLGYLLFKYAEEPLRTERNRKTASLAKPAFVGAMLSFCAMAVAMQSQSVTQSILPTRYLRLAEQDKEYATAFSNCSTTSTFEKVCSIGPDGERPTYLVWGDSHAAHLKSGLDELAIGQNIRTLISTRSTCPPLINAVPERNDKSMLLCKENNAAGLLVAKDPAGPKTVVLAARWAYYNDRQKALIDDKGKPINIVSAIRDTLNALADAGKRVIIVAQAPETSGQTSACRRAFVFESSNFDASCTIKNLDVLQEQERLHVKLQNLANQYDFAKLIRLEDALCEGPHCKIADKTGVFYRDEDHLSAIGSRKAVEHIFIGM